MVWGMCILVLGGLGESLDGVTALLGARQTYFSKAVQDAAGQKTQRHQTWNTLLGKASKDLKEVSPFCWSHTTPHIPSYLWNLPKGTLVILDADFGMGIPEDALFSSEDRGAILSRLSEKKRANLFTNLPMKPLDSTLLPLLKQWKKRGNVTVMALHSNGRFWDSGLRSDTDRKNYVQRQQEIGYTLENFWKDVPLKNFEQSHEHNGPFGVLEGREEGRAWPTNPKFPTLHKGVVFSNDFTGVSSLEAFLGLLPQRPKQLVFVGRALDSKKWKGGMGPLQMGDVAKKMTSNTLMVSCLKRPSTLSPFMRKRANVKVDQFCKTDEWLSDVQADKVMEAASKKKSTLKTGPVSKKKGGNTPEIH